MNDVRSGDTAGRVAMRPWKIVAAVALAVALLLVGLKLITASQETRPSSQEAADVHSSHDGHDHAARTVTKQVANETAAPKKSKAVPASDARLLSPGVTSERGRSGQTITYRHDFRGGNVNPGLFALLENVEPTHDGFQLKKKSDGTFPASGTIQSSPIPTEISINAFGPHWLQHTPEATGVKFEVASSSDGQSWTEWHPVQVDPHADSPPELQDGTPNPNHGHTFGTLVSRTDNSGTYLRYRITLTTEKPEVSPALERIAITYMDSSDPATRHVLEKEPLKK